MRDLSDADLADRPSTSEPDIEAILATISPDYAGRLVWVSHLHVEDADGQRSLVTLASPALARVLPKSSQERPFAWDGQDAIYHVFPLRVVAPHPELDGLTPRHGLGFGLTKSGQNVGSAPRKAAWYRRLRHLLS